MRWWTAQRVTQATQPVKLMDPVTRLVAHRLAEQSSDGTFLKVGNTFLDYEP